MTPPEVAVRPRGADLGTLTQADLDGAVRAMLDAAREHLGLEMAVLSGVSNGALGDAPDVAEGGDARGCITVPLRLSDGRACGTLACAPPDSHAPAPGERVEAVRLLAHLIVERIELRASELESWRAEITSTGVQALLAALEARDAYIKEHSEAVVELSTAAAQQLDVSPSALDEVKQVALLHDLGKIAMPEHILAKPGMLEAEEWEQMRRHSEIGAGIVASVESLAHLAPAIRAAHERWDGLGYPDGLAGEAIPLASRIVSLCDAYHAMVSDRPYRPAMRRADAVREVARAAGTQFCPTCVGALATAV